MNHLADPRLSSAAVRAMTVGAPGRLAMSLDATPSAVPPVRHVVAEHLALWGGPLPELSDRALIAVSELLTNVCEHTAPDRDGRRQAQMLVQCVPGGLRINVRDRDTRRPQVRTPSDGDETGRGMLLLRAVADDLGVRVGATGKDIWATILREDTPGATAGTAHRGRTCH